MAAPKPPTRHQLAAREGYRPLTLGEKAHLGLAKTNRDYTKQRAGIKLGSLKRDKVVARRKVEKEFLGSFERAAKINRAKRGGRAPTDRYYRYAKAYAQKYGLTISEAEKAPGFRALYKIAKKKNRKRTKSSNKTRIIALHDLGIIGDETYEDLRDREFDTP